MTATLSPPVKILPRTPDAASRIIRLKAHADFERKSNGKLAGYSAVARMFRDEMAQMKEELGLLSIPRNEAEEAALWRCIWNHIAGLHKVFGKEGQVDDLVTLLLLTRQEFIHKEVPPALVEVLQEVVGEMSDGKHGTALTRSVMKRLKQAGVNLRRGAKAA